MKTSEKPYFPAARLNWFLHSYLKVAIGFFSLLLRAKVLKNKIIYGYLLFNTYLPGNNYSA